MIKDVLDKNLSLNETLQKLGIEAVDVGCGSKNLTSEGVLLKTGKDEEIWEWLKELAGVEALAEEAEDLGE